MIQELLRLVGWPVCAREGCGMPSVVRFEFSDDKGPVWVDLCPVCVTEIRKCLDEVGTVMNERREIDGGSEMNENGGTP